MLKSKKENHLLYWGAGIFSCTLIVYTIISSYFPNLTKTRDIFGDFDNILLIIVFTLLLAPVLEELIFRSIFIIKKNYIFCFYIGVVAMILVTQNYYLFLILITTFFIYRKRKTFNTNPLYFLNSLLFALIHYKLSDFTNIFSFIPVFFQFSIALILIWITINYSLIWSMVLHFFINASIIIPLVFLIQFPEMKQNSIITNEIKFEWKKTPVLGKTKIIYTSDKVEAKRITISQLIKIFNPKEIDFQVNDSLKYYRYNFTIENLNNHKIELKQVKKILINHNLIENVENK